MSGAALAWALKQPVPMSSAKFVLVVMADQTTTDLAFMSLAALSEATAQDRKTVVASISRLIEWGLIEDTGERRGRTGQIPVYRLQLGAGLFDNEHHDPKQPKNGTVPKTVPVPKTDGNSTVFPIEQSQKRYTDPKLTQHDPTHTPRGREAAAAAASEPAEIPLPPEPSSGALATRAMIEAGMPPSRVNPSHPELLRALEAGVTPAELADVVRERMGNGHDPPAMTYVIRTAQGRRRDAAATASNPDHAASQIHSRSADGAPSNRARSAIERQVDAINALRKRRGAT